jgi:uncharacterized lipoprotein YmbA
MEQTCMSHPLKTWIGRVSPLIVAAAIATVSGCSSAPIHYHTLVPIKGSSTSTSQYDIVIDRVTMPPQVDRSQMVIRQGNSGLVILETEWWGANLTDELANALGSQLPQPSGTTSGRSKLHLTLDVQRFDSVPGQYALIEAKWRLRSRDANIKMECYTKLSTPAGNSIDELVIAHQGNLMKLSSMIEAAGRSGRCS